ncbi:MAG TPA: hypothetical protein VKB50_28145 [Vicinamibacterales bacterium]|nr:hypothetical protein [Vicinamibacterales bacterium]
METVHTSSDLDHFRQRLVAENQAIRSRRRAAVLECADLSVGATEANLAHSEQHAGRVLQLGLRYIDELKTLLRWKDG